MDGGLRALIVFSAAFVVSGCLGAAGAPKLPQSINPPTTPLTISVHAPSSTSGFLSVLHVGDTIAFTASSSGGRQGASLNYSWTLEKPTASSANLAPDAASASFAPDVPGRYTARVTVSDGSATATATGTVDVTAYPPPVASFGLPRYVEAGKPVNVDASSSYPRVERDVTMSYSWRVASQPAGGAAFFSEAESATTTFTATVGGEHEIELTVSDGRATGTRILSTTAIEDSPPDAKIGPTQDFRDAAIGEGLLVSAIDEPHVALTSFGSWDPDHITLNHRITDYKWTVIDQPPGSTVELEAVDVPFGDGRRVVADTPGEYVIELVVTANGLQSGPATMQVRYFERRFDPAESMSYAPGTAEAIGFTPSEVSSYAGLEVGDGRTRLVALLGRAVAWSTSELFLARFRHEAEGLVLEQIEQLDRRSLTFTSLRTADITGDGRDEIIIDQSGRDVLVLDADLNVLGESPHAGGQLMWSGVADLLGTGTSQFLQVRAAQDSPHLRPSETIDVYSYTAGTGLVHTSIALPSDAYFRGLYQPTGDPRIGVRLGVGEAPTALWLYDAGAWVHHMDLAGLRSQSTAVPVENGAALGFVDWDPISSGGTGDAALIATDAVDGMTLLPLGRLPNMPVVGATPSGASPGLMVGWAWANRTISVLFTDDGATYSDVHLYRGAPVDHTTITLPVIGDVTGDGIRDLVAGRLLLRGRP